MASGNSPSPVWSVLPSSTSAATLAAMARPAAPIRGGGIPKGARSVSSTASSRDAGIASWPKVKGTRGLTSAITVRAAATAASM
jgi:hypothetical protein